MLKRLQRFGFEKKLRKAHEDDSLFVSPWTFARVSHDDHFAETVAYVRERIGLLLAFLRIRNSKGGLNIYAFGRFVQYKINLAHLACLGDAVGGKRFHRAYIDAVPESAKFVVYDIFHEMGSLDLSELRAGVPYAGIDSVVLRGIIKIPLSLYVKSGCPLDNKRLFKEFQVFRYRHVVAFDLAGGIDGVCEFCRICESANVAHDRVCQGGEKNVVPELVPVGYVAQIDGFAKIVQIRHFLFFRFKKHTFGKPPISKVFVPYLVELESAFHERMELGEGKRLHLNDFAAASKFGGDITRKEMGVGTCHVDIREAKAKKTVEDIVERSIGGWSVFRSHARDIHSRCESGTGMLDFVNEDVVCSSVMDEQRSNGIAKGYGIATCPEGVGFKIDFDDMIILDSAFQKVVLEECEQKKAFAAPSDACKDFDEIVILCGDETVQKLWSHNDGMFFHLYPPLFSFGLLQKLKARRLYQIPLVVATGTFNFCKELQKMKVAARVQLPSSRRNGRIRRLGISTTRKRLAPSIRLRNPPKGIGSKVK